MTTLLSTPLLHYVKIVLTLTRLIKIFTDIGSIKNLVEICRQIGSKRKQQKFDAYQRRIDASSGQKKRGFICPNFFRHFSPFGNEWTALTLFDGTFCFTLFVAHQSAAIINDVIVLLFFWFFFGGLAN
uniref:Uncharacterized protein n=1 Tax=Globodera rostochiensis TaxID=31243 RepID=A0A914HX04_GLORO